MQEPLLEFVSPLSNTDSSILGLRLKHGFRIEKLSKREYDDFLTTCHGGLIPGSFEKEYIWYYNSKEESAYVVRRPIETDWTQYKVEPGKALFTASAKFQREYEIGYLDKVMSLLILFKEGAIFNPDRYYVLSDQGSRKAIMSMGSLHHVPFAPRYVIMQSELDTLHEFLEATVFPFEMPYLRMAFDNFLESYRLLSSSMSFLSLMVALEALLGRGSSELTYSLARNAAVLLGKDKDDSRRVFGSIKAFYGTRSRLVHGDEKPKGETESIDESDVLALRGTIRESIKEVYMIRKDKSELLDLLKESAYGSRSARMQSV